MLEIGPVFPPIGWGPWGTLQAAECNPLIVGAPVPEWLGVPGKLTLAGRIWPMGHSLGTPGLLKSVLKSQRLSNMFFWSTVLPGSRGKKPPHSCTYKTHLVPFSKLFL